MTTVSLARAAALAWLLAAAAQTQAQGVAQGAVEEASAGGEDGTVALAEIPVEALVGAAVVNGAGETIASVADVLLDDAGAVDSVAASFGGLFGFATDIVLLTPDEVTVVRDGGGTLTVRTRLTPEDLEGRPDYAAPG